MAYDYSPEPMSASLKRGHKRVRAGTYLVTQPNAHLTKWVNDYTGWNLIHRCTFIADVCPSLAAEALQLALKEVKSATVDVNKYLELAGQLQSLHPVPGQSTRPDEEEEEDTKAILTTEEEIWCQTTLTNTNKQLNRLYQEMQDYRINAMREPMRVIMLEQAAMHYKSGQFDAALRDYQRTKEYSTTADHLLTCSMGLVSVALAERKYGAIPMMLTRVEEALKSMSEEQSKVHRRKVAIARGIAALEGGMYEEAADAFATVHLIIDEKEKEKDNVLSATDLAKCLVLCALAAYDRKKLSTVMAQPHVRDILECDTTMRDLMDRYLSSSWQNWLADFDEHRKQEWMLDMYLAPQMDRLVSCIKDHVLLSYIKPFSLVDLHRMATELSIPQKDLTRSILAVLSTSRLNGRVDAIANTLHVEKETPEAAERLMWQTMRRATALYEDTVCLMRHRAMLLKDPSFAQESSRSEEDVSDTRLERTMAAFDRSEDVEMAS